MTDAEKIAAFDDIAKAFTNQWSDGTWTWFCIQPSGGTCLPKRATRAEAVADLIAFARRERNHLEKRGKAFAAMRAE